MGGEGSKYLGGVHREVLLLIFRKEGVAFVHVPKTCGKVFREFLSSSVGGAEEWWGIETTEEGSPESLRFDMVDRAHYTAGMLKEFRPDAFGELLGMRVFSVARDPYARAASAYEQYLGHVGQERDLGFLDYLRCVRDGMHRDARDGYLYIHGAPQVEFHLPHHELLAGRDFSGALSELFGRPLLLFSEERPVSPLGIEEREMVEEVYRADIEMWERLAS